MDATFDYVIVGAGSAGCVLANRLSAGDATVLVVEAGEPDDEREIQIPAAFTELFRTEYDWDYATVPQPELGDRELYWPRGKTLGGSSSINAMIHVRGHPADYDEWADRGNEGWAWKDVLATFKRLEADDGGVDDGGADEYHGRDGPMHVSRPEPPEVTAAWIEAAEAAGIPRNDDFNGETLAGVGPFPVSVKGGKRHSAATAYLHPALDRSTLRAETGAHATRILFEDHEAVGVEYEQDGETHRVGADSEVIVSGGAINSPQLLMLSGVGPASHLAEHGIDVVCDLPGVGQNLQDHIQAGLVFECEGAPTVDGADSLLNVLRFLLFKSGPLTTNVAEAGAFVRSDGALDAPDLEFHFARSHYIEHAFGNPEEGQAISFGPTLLTPESTGEIRLQSADPSEHPAIDPRYFTADADLDRMVEGVRIALDVAEQSPLDPYRGERVWPGHDLDSDDAIADCLRETAETIYHPVGTCAMGPKAIDGAVVDDDLRVHGVENLRVVDASVMPTVPRGNTNIPTIMVAERAAEQIRADAA